MRVRMALRWLDVYSGSKTWICEGHGGGYGLAWLFHAFVLRWQDAKGRERAGSSSSEWHRVRKSIVVGKRVAG